MKEAAGRVFMSASLCTGIIYGVKTVSTEATKSMLCHFWFHFKDVFSEFSLEFIVIVWEMKTHVVSIAASFWCYENLRWA